MLAALLGGLSSLGLNAASSLMSYSLNKALQDDAQKHQIKMMRNAHQWEVGDLRKAGLNPILSAGGSPGSYGSSALSAGSTDLGKGLTDSIETAQDLANETKKKEVDLLDEQKETQKSQQDLNSALAKKALADAKQKTALTPPSVKDVFNKTKDIVSPVSSALGKKAGDMLFNNKKSDYAFEPNWERRKLDRDLKHTGIGIIEKNGSRTEYFSDSKGKIFRKNVK